MALNDLLSQRSFILHVFKGTPDEFWQAQQIRVNAMNRHEPCTVILYRIRHSDDQLFIYNRGKMIGSKTARSLNLEFLESRTLVSENHPPPSPPYRTSQSDAKGSPRPNLRLVK